MTSSDDDARRNDPDESSASGSEPSPSGYEAPSIEQSGLYPPPPPTYPPPPAYGAPPADGGFATPGYPPPPPGYGPAGDYPTPAYPPPAYPPPYPDPGAYPPPYGGTPGGYPPGYPGPDWGYPPAGYPPPPQGTNTLAIGSLVASIIGICCGLGSVVGIVLGVIALNQVKETRQSGHGLAVAGIAVGVVTLVLSVVWTLLVMAAGSS